MAEATRFPRRLIEVDLPIKTISQNARREKNVRHGHLSTLHLWWARRPLAACRSVILAALLPDPCDPLCPAAFRTSAAQTLQTLRDSVGGPPTDWKNPEALREALLAFIAAFSNWDVAGHPAFLAASRSLVLASSTALGGAAGTYPLVLDPFAGGGAIPVEVARVGAEPYATDLNPVAVLLNRVAVEFVPRHGTALVDAVRSLAVGVQAEAKKRLGEFYPSDKDGAVPVAYLWARTIRCEGPGCGTVVPMIRSPWLSKKSGKTAALKLTADPKRKEILVEVVDRPKEAGAGTIRRGSVTCPACGYTTKVDRVRMQLRERHGGAHDAQLLCVVVTRPGESGRFFRLPSESDRAAISRSKQRVAEPCSQRI